MFGWLFGGGFLYGLIAIIIASVLGVFIKHYDDTIRNAALNEYNLKQAQQTITDQNKTIDDLRVINKSKEDAVDELNRERAAIEKSLVEIEKRISNNPKVSDRKASELLKETIRELEGVVP